MNGGDGDAAHSDRDVVNRPAGEPGEAGERESVVGVDKGPVPVYLAGLRAALADLPDGEVAEILDDVGAHLTDVVADIRRDGTDADMAALTARLSTPTAYAAELRAAAGYPPRPPDEVARRGVVQARLAVVGLVGSTLLALAAIGGGDPGTVLLALLVGLVALPALLRDGPRMPSVVALPEVRRFLGSAPAPGSGWGRIAGFATALQPAWWLLRAVVATVLFVAVFGIGGRDGIVAIVLVGLLAVPISVWLGGRSRRDRRLLWAVVPLNAVATALCVVAMVGLGSVVLGSAALGFGAPQPASAGGYQAGLWQDGERQVRDIRPVDSAGVPLTGVYLFDQDGRPLNTDGSCGYGYDVGEPRPDPARPYPRGVTEPDPQTGRCVTVPPAPLVVAVPSPTPAATAPPAGPPPAATAPTPTPVPTG